MSEYWYPFRTRVRYAETDQMGVVHHSVYPIWFEAARSEFSRAAGLAYMEWERRGVLLMVSDVACRFRKPAHYDEEVTVRVRVAEVASRRVVFAYVVAGESGDVLAEGETRHLVVDKLSGRPMVIPQDCRDALLRRPVPAA
jgi:acyl-CoA thioester hydrolase